MHLYFDRKHIGRFQIFIARVIISLNDFYLQGKISIILFANVSGMQKTILYTNEGSDCFFELCF